ncbi:MAG: hypothetical protein QF464_21035, partial [Myxococcota bacterium]|nr:hypothetical protein [Myxococcota bacterium]
MRLGCAIGALCWLLVGGGAVASEVGVVPAQGQLVPGVPTVIWVAVDDRVGGASAVRPRVSTNGGTVRPRRTPSPQGVWAYTLTPPIGVGHVEVTVASGDERHQVELPVAFPRRDPLILPSRLVGSARAGEVRFLVTGDDLPPSDVLEVVTSEGEVRSVIEVDEGLEVSIRTEVSPFPRVVVVGVRDTRGRGLPVWGQIRMKAKPQLPIQTEPDAKVEIMVGG